MWLSIFVLMAFAWDGRATGIIMVEDPIDDQALVDGVSGQKPVKAFATEIDALEKMLLANKDKEKINQILGKPGPKPTKGYAIPISQHRVYGVSGLGPADPKLRKDHMAYYAIGDFAGIEIRYGITGTHPQFAVLYFKVDDAFPKLKTVEDKSSDKPAEPKKKPVATRKHTIDLEHWETMTRSMNKEQIAKHFSAPAGDYAPGTDYLTRKWGWRRGDDGKVHETLEWRSEKGRIIVEFDEKGAFVTSEFYKPGRDPVTNIAERLKWDRVKFEKVKKYVEERMAAK
jgi:hypothetical protein